MQRRMFKGVVLSVVGLCSLMLVDVVRSDDKVDPTGTWKWKRERQGREIESILTIKLDGEKVTGSYQGGRGGKVDIQNGKLDGVKLSFEVEREFNDQKRTIRFEGKLNGNKVAGKVSFGSREFDWEATRSVELSAIVGTWQLRIEAGDRTLEPSITFSADGDKLVASYTGNSEEREVKELKFDGQQLTFKIGGERDGNQWSVVYKGKVKGDSIQGTIDYDFGDNTGTVDFEGSRRKDV